MSVLTFPTSLQRKPGPSYPILELFPEQGQWSEGEYLALTDHERKLVEFTDGFIEVLPMPTLLHQLIAQFLLYQLNTWADAGHGGLAVLASFRMRVRKDKIREPDVLFLRKENMHRLANRLWDYADLVMEVVSDDDPKRDHVEKRQDYAEGHIPEYWIVDPRDGIRSITVLKLDGDAYAEHGIFTAGQTATSPHLPGFTVDVAACFAAGDAAPKD